MSHPAGHLTGDTGRPRRGPAVVVAVTALTVGLLLGGLAGALLAGSTDGDTAGGQGAPTTGAPAPSSGPGDVEVRIGEACIQALDAARQAADAVDGAGQALAALDAARLDEVVHRLQPLEQQLREGVDDCDVAAQLPDGSEDAPPPPAPTSPGG